MDLIPADLRPHLQRLRLSTRLSAQTQGFGLQTSRNRGSGLEFAQYRAYEPGDEPRLIDWKLFARSDRHYVREADRDSALRVWLLIDATASMAQADIARPDYSRLAAAKILAACVVEVALRQGDRFGLMVLGDGKLSMTPAAEGVRQRNRCLLALRELRAGGEWPTIDSLEPIWAHTGPHDLIVALSDDFDESALSLFERLAKARRELRNIQILCADERDFAFRHGHRFIDPESGEALITDAPAARAQFLQNFGAAQQQLQRRLAGSGIGYALHHLDQPLIDALLPLFGVGKTRGASS